MAVQDDNTILKKADLKAYHQQIAGQLGGTFALRTNNGDYFSTDEKVVGVYIDGKPLYQKSFKIMATSRPFTSTSRSWVSLAPNAVANMDVGWVDQGRSFILWNDGSRKPATAPHNTPSSEYWYIQLNDSGSITACSQGSAGLYGIRSASSSYYFITLLYTKTTDQPNSAITSGAYDISFPNTWPANTEVFLGNGVYGYRATGTVSVSTNATANALFDPGQKFNFISTGGHILRPNGYVLAVPTTMNHATVMAFIEEAGNFLSLTTRSLASETWTYDVWATYLKGGN